MRNAGLRVLAALAALAPAAAAQHPLVKLPLADPAYIQLDGLVRQGCVPARVSPYRPYLVLAVRQALVAAHKERNCAGPILELLTARFARDTGWVHDTTGSRLRFGSSLSVIGTGLSGGVVQPLWLDVRPADSGAQPVVGLAKARLTFNGGANFTAMTEIFGQTGTRNDPTIQEEPFRHGPGVIGVNEAYFSGRAGPVFLFFGREPVAWAGDGAQSLALSANGPPTDHFSFAIRLKQWEFQSFVGQLSDVTLTPQVDSVATEERWLRTLYAHALTFWPVPAVELSFGETALVPRTTGGLDWAYLNPLMPYQLTQHESNQQGAGDANLTAFLTVRATVSRATLTGELLIDDYQLDANDKKIYPNQLAWVLGATYPVPLGLSASVGLNWQHVQGFTYVGQPTFAKVYQNYEAPIGLNLGPDAQTVTGLLDVFASSRLHFTGELGWWERGAMRLDQRPPVDRTGHANDPYPDTTALRPEVQSSVTAGLTAQWLDETWPISLEIGDARIDNVNNQPTDS
ncbi:MAG TPA: hypothetical protein VMT93_09895, partial [Gemmatimonadaceae bacterium]|nr:hypothetical protein [Gemmatimonadaceae bacterium]